MMDKAVLTRSKDSDDSEKEYFCPPETCEICFEDMKLSSRFRRLPCNHIFHKPCIDSWMRCCGTTCPLCRHQFDLDHAVVLTRFDNPRFKGKRHFNPRKPWGLIGIWWGRWHNGL
ncbi:hypothetical protein BDV27DRAFT_119135 [Aspergillus caelatus]|uniref:RING-type domain-containing protein n=1 Tax=Aspergillus caelatus TaxID=61420 RepID=A0A5N7ANL4_9EURO|nr:uncharacterized protein BDV27DRAFT_119135 [Aspergillus caelatus]KAE8370876.1 hypothetical protein BDV27DRAFT_119135 [Aspergillus caelatus]